MNRALKPIFITVCILVLLGIGLLIAHKAVENKVFGMLTNQPGMSITIGSKHGNLFKGYNLSNVTIKQTRTGNNFVPATFDTPNLRIHWKLNPFLLSDIHWGNSELILETEQKSETIPIQTGTLIPDNSGWMNSINPVQVGPNEWNGTMTLSIRQDGKEIKGQVEIERLPSEMIRLLGEVPQGFTLPQTVKVSMELSGSPQGMVAHGSVTDPLTRRSFRF